MVFLSIVIPAHNEEKTIGMCLKSLLPQLKNNIELIIVNDGSTDKTKEIVKSMIKKTRNVKLLNFSQGHSAAFARNRGSKLAKGSWLVFLDADHIVEKSFIKKLTEHLKNANFDGSDYMVFSYKPRTLIQRAWSIYREMHPSTGLTHIIKRSVFKRLKGFREDIFYYEDEDLRRRFHAMGFKFCGPLPIKVFHVEPETFNDFFRQRKWQGRGIACFLKRGDIFVLKYFLPVVLLFTLPFTLLPSMAYFLLMIIYLAYRTRRLVDSTLWTFFDLIGRIISFPYFILEMVR